MAAIRRYTHDQLLNLRASPLVQKPENLPAIEQWIEYVYATSDSREKLRIPHSESHQAQNANNGAGNGSGQANTRQKNQQGGKTGAVAGDASPMGNFSTGVRPSLMGARSARNGEDVSLGPPRTMFPSSRNVTKLSDFAGEKAGEGNGGEELETVRRTFGDKGNRKSANEKEYGDRWTTVREKRLAEDGQRQDGKYGRRDREQDGERRNGDSRWGGRDETRQNGDRTSWRDRERDKKERNWERGGGRVEKEPEWMDDPAPPGGEDDLRTMGMPRNQEQFQKWKEAMSGKKSSADAELAEPPPMRQTMATKPAATLDIEGFLDKPFGAWGDATASATGSVDPTVVTAAKAAQPKGKSSRFASMFSKDAQSKDEPAPEPKQVPGVANGNPEDEAGFQRILQMLGGTGIGQGTPNEIPASPPAKNGGSGARQKSRFTGFFDQTPKSPERNQSPPPPDFGGRANEAEHSQGGRRRPNDPTTKFGAGLPERQSDQPRDIAKSNPMSPQPEPAGLREQQRQPPHQRPSDVFLEQPPSRGAATPDINIQNLLASQRAQRQDGGQDKNSAFLLNLLQTKGSSRPPSQQARPDNNFPLWLDQPTNVQEPHAPKPRVPPPPGLFEDQLLRNASQEPPRHELPHSMPGEMPQRRTSQRAPPGFYDEQAMYMQQAQAAHQAREIQAAQRARNYNEPPQQLPPVGRRMSGHPSLPPMQIPNMQQQFQPGMPQPPPDFMQSPGVQQGPPPGFNPHMPRHPPGIHNIPNIFQAPQQPPQLPPQAGREPPGYGGMPAPGGMQSPPNAPPGFYGGQPGLPPGFMQMRSPTDGIPNMRGPRPFDAGFDGPGPRR